MISVHTLLCIYFFFNETATTQIYTLSLHDALPIFRIMEIDIDSVAWRDELFLNAPAIEDGQLIVPKGPGWGVEVDRKSTRLNSSHQIISYAVFCLKKKKTIRDSRPQTSSTYIVTSS